ncbi:MAG: hypothetical protein ABI137_04980 [Antricoccus sp.]
MQAAHRANLLAVAHVSTDPGAVLVASCGVDVLAHAPFSAMTDVEINEVARSGVALIATLSILDGFPIDGLMPLLDQPAIKARLTVQWQPVIERQGERWMPLEAPNGAAQRENVLALLESGVPIICVTDAPNPALLPGPSLHQILHCSPARHCTGSFSSLSERDCAQSRLYKLRPAQQPGCSACTTGG